MPKLIHTLPLAAAAVGLLAAMLQPACESVPSLAAAGAAAGV